MSEIDDFLAGKGADEPAPAPEPQAEAPSPAPEQEAPPEAAPESEPEAEPQPTRDGRTVPLSALEGERKARQDWKDKAARAETERDELRKQLEEIKRQPQQAPPQQYQPPPVNPVEDPQGFLARTQEVILNERLNTSEMLVRDKLGDEAVEQAIATFKEAAQADPGLFQKLYSQPNPYGWMVKQAEAIKLQKEIGEDPAAYRARLRAELEAEIRGATSALHAPAQSPAANLPPSLATARSAAPRGAPAFSGPPPLEDIFRR